VVVVLFFQEINSIAELLHTFIMPERFTIMCYFLLVLAITRSNGESVWNSSASSITHLSNTPSPTPELLEKEGRSTKKIELSMVVVVDSVSRTIQSTRNESDSIATRMFVNIPTDSLSQSSPSSSLPLLLDESYPPSEIPVSSLSFDQSKSLLVTLSTIKSSPSTLMVKLYKTEVTPSIHQSELISRGKRK